MTFQSGFRGISQTSFCANRDADNRAFREIETCGFARMRMWSQYGDKHRGVCLAYSRKHLANYIEANENEKCHFVFGDVNYREFPLYETSYFHISGQSVSEVGVSSFVAARISKEYWTEYLLTKSRDYEKEQEYKICAILSEPKSLYIPAVPGLKAIVLGIRYPETFRPAAIEVGRKLSVPVFFMYWHSGEPNVAGLDEGFEDSRDRDDEEIES